MGKSRKNFRKKGMCVCIMLLLMCSVFTLVLPKEKNMSRGLKNQNNCIVKKIENNIANLKNFFTKNEGQLQNKEIYFTYSSLKINFGFLESSVLIKISKRLDENKTQSSVIKLSFENSNKVIPIGKEELNHKSNYFIGNKPSKWRTNVLNYKNIIYENLYDGIDLVYYFNEKGLKYNWIVKPYANPSKIFEKFEGTDSLKLDSFGALIIETKAGKIVYDKPYTYQKISENIVEIESKYHIFGKNKVTYDIGKYDISKDLIIDPLIYSTFIGKSNNDTVGDIVLDSDNNVYITGYTESEDFPTTPNCYNETHGEYADIFVLKLNSNLSSLIYSTFVGGKGFEEGCSIALDKENNVYITGNTWSEDFPTLRGYDNSYNGKEDVFVFKLNWNGTELLYSTFVGGEKYDYGLDIVLDKENNAYVTGVTESTDFPTNAFDKSFNGGRDVFVFKLASNGSYLPYSTFIGTQDNEWGTGIAVDSKNNIYITGYTESEDFPTTPNSYNETHGKYDDVFVLKLDSNLSSLIYSTFVGGNGNDRALSIALDLNNNAYITGNTNSTDFPTTKNCFDNSHNGNYDVFVFKLNSNGTKLKNSTFIGGSHNDYGEDIALDSENNIYVTGRTQSQDFPTTPNCFNSSFNGDRDTFVIKLRSNFSDLFYSTYVGGKDYDDGKDIALDFENNVYITGWTNSFDFPTTLQTFNDSYGGGWDVFLFKLNAGMPKATIDEITPNPANEDEDVNFYGNGTDDGKIIDYEWSSSIDGFLSSNQSFSISNLSNGTHVILFKVKDNNNTWSMPAKIILTINGIPRANIDKITPKLVNEGKKIFFKGNYTDFENNITEFYWESNISGFLSDKRNFSISNLSNGTHKIIFRVKDSFGVWSKNVTETIIVNGIPRAKIYQINPNPAKEGIEVNFYGHGTDDGKIIGYEWSSSIDGLLSSNQSFGISNLSNGTHEISLIVKDNFGVWSDKVIKNLTINGIPSAKIDLISKNPSNENEKVIFIGNYTDFENNVTEFIWESNIDGILSREKEFSTSNLSNGTHKISFMVRDNFGTWSKIVTKTLIINGIPFARIESINPNPAIFGKEIFFKGNYTDFENNIVQYLWESDIDGFLSNEISFTKDNLSVGKHNISFIVKDNFGVWSKKEIMMLEIKQRIEKLEIVDIISPDTALENKQILIKAKIRNNGNVPISNFTVVFYYNNIKISSKLFNETLKPNNEILVETKWQTVLGNHTIKVRVLSEEGKLLDSNISAKKLEVIKIPKEEEEKGYFILYILIILFIILVILALQINRWYGTIEKKKSKGEKKEFEDNIKEDKKNEI